MTLNNLIYVLRDVLFPLPEPPSPKEREDRKIRECAERLQIDGSADLRPCLNGYSSLLEMERSRRESAEKRLTSILGLTSIAGTLVFGEIFALATGTIHSPNLTLTIIVSLGTIYLVLQIASATIAAVRGLSRQTYQIPTIDDLVEKSGEGPTAHRHRETVLLFERYFEMRELNNNKITQMATAHRATINFISAVVLLAFAGSFFALTAHPENDFLRLVKQNQQLQELLRGSQGPTGPPGPRGEQGPPGRTVRAEKRSTEQ